jgi:hypothetical protein
MPIDTAAKRRSASGVGHRIGGRGISPDAAKPAAWRQQAGWGYSGIAAGAAVVAAQPGGTFRRYDAARAFRRYDTARAFRGGSRVADSIQRTTLVKDASETVSFIFDFTRFPEYVAGETLASPSVPAVSGLTIGSPAVTDEDRDDVEEAGGVEVTISGGTAGVEYSIECFATFSGGAIRCVKGVLAVE